MYLTLDELTAERIQELVFYHPQQKENAIKKTYQQFVSPDKLF